MSSTVILGNCQKNGSLGRTYELNQNLKFIYIFYHAHLFGDSALVCHLSCRHLGVAAQPPTALFSLCRTAAGYLHAILLGGIISQTGWPSVFYIFGKLLSPHAQVFISRGLFWYLTVCTFLEEMSQDRKILVKQNVLI